MGVVPKLLGRVLPGVHGSIPSSTAFSWLGVAGSDGAWKLGER